MSNKKRTAWLSIERPDGNRRLYQITTIESFRLTDDDGLYCLGCGQLVKPEFDTIQFGFWDTSFTTVFTCEPCGKAYRVDYVVNDDVVDGVTDKKGI